MPRQHIAQDADVQLHEQPTALHVLLRPFHVGDVLPMRMNAEDMCRAFGLGIKNFYNRRSQGAFDRFELLPRIGKRAWSGVLVGQYLSGQAVSRIFGRKAR